MRQRTVPFLGIISLALALIVPAFAQDSKTLSSAAGDVYVISAKAGGINFVEGSASVRRADGRSGLVVKGDELDSGDVVETSGAGRVEILLNPGSYARLDRNSKVELATTTLDDLRLKMLRGSAIFEVFASDDFKVTVNTPKTELYLVKTGVYRVDVDENGVARLEVWNGRAETSADNDEALKKGRYATFDGSDVEVAKFDRGNKDEFESWSKDRAELIAKANKKLQRRVLSDSLLRGFRADAWDCYSSMGLWVYSRRYSVYSFLPFGYGWRSPYGYGLRTSTQICYDPAYFYYRPYRGIVGGGGKSTGGGSTGTTSPQIPQANIERANRNRTPPFQRMEQNREVKRDWPVIVGTPGIRPTFDTGSRSSGSGSTKSTSSQQTTKSSTTRTKGKDN